VSKQTETKKYKSMKSNKIILVLMSAFFIVGITNAQNGMGKSQTSMHKSDCSRFESNLSDEQSEAIEKIHVKTKADIQPLMADIEIKQAELNKLRTSDKPDLKAINKKVDEISILRVQKEKIRMSAEQEIRLLLNDEQRVEFDMHLLKKEKGGSYHAKDMNRMHRNFDSKQVGTHNN
jgi:Spy/CpxP family protein refolding chaperone